MSNIRYSLIVPIYKNELNIQSLIEALKSLRQKLDSSFETVLVVDGSPDSSLQLLSEQLPDAGLNYQLLSLSRNFGSFAAIRTGFQNARGEYLAVMAADLQEPIGLIEEFYSALEKENFDLVIGRRESRVDNSFSSDLFWKLYKKFIIKEIPEGGVDIFGCNQRFCKELLKLNEANSSLVGQIFWLGFRKKFINYARQERESGSSAWTFKKKVNYMLDSVFSFSDLPIKILLFVGIVGICCSFLLGLLVIICKVFALISVPGYTATILVILMFMGLNSLGLGIIGSYLWRTFENTKLRPLSIVLDKIVNDNDNDNDNNNG